MMGTSESRGGAGVLLPHAQVQMWNIVDQLFEILGVVCLSSPGRD